MDKLLALLFGNPLYLLIAAVAIFAAGAGSGWTVNGWRLGAEVATLEGKVGTLTLLNDTYKTANKTCADNVKDVKDALAAFYKVQAAIQKSVDAAIAKAAPQAAEHLRKAEEILKQAAVPKEQWCPTIIKEQEAYVVLRSEQRLKSLEGK